VPEVYDEFVIEGNSAILKCVVPNYMKDLITVTNWIKEPNTVIQQTSLNQLIDKLKQSKSNDCFEGIPSEFAILSLI